MTTKKSQKECFIELERGFFVKLNRSNVEYNQKLSRAKAFQSEEAADTVLKKLISKGIYARIVTFEYYNDFKAKVLAGVCRASEYLQQQQKDFSRNMFG